MRMTYSQFEEELLVAIVKTADANSAADPNSLGQVDVMVVASEVSPCASEQLVRSVVGRFKGLGWVCNVVEPISGGIWLMVTGDGRRKAESLG